MLVRLQSFYPHHTYDEGAKQRQVLHINCRYCYSMAIQNPLVQSRGRAGLKYWN